MVSGSGRFRASSGLAAAACVLIACGQTERTRTGPGAASAGSSSAVAAAGVTSATGGSDSGGTSSPDTGGMGGAIRFPAGNVAGCVDLSDDGPHGPSAPDFGPPPGIDMHRCEVQLDRDPDCELKPLTGDFEISSDQDMAALEGVTSIDGSLVVQGVAGFDALHCLESITGTLSISVTSPTDTALNGLRHLISVGGVALSSSGGRLYTDCAFTRLRQVGPDTGADAGFDVTGNVALWLDLGYLERVGYLRLVGTQIRTLQLAGGGTLVLGRVQIENNLSLSDITMFRGAQVVPISGSFPADEPRVRVQGNPYLSQCKAQALAQPFLDAGVDTKSVILDANQPCSYPLCSK